MLISFNTGRKTALVRSLLTREEWVVVIRRPDCLNGS